MEQDKRIPYNEFANDLEYMPSMDTAWHHWLQDRYAKEREWYKVHRIEKNEDNKEKV
jgi:hypothetical protein